MKIILDKERDVRRLITPHALFDAKRKATLTHDEIKRAMYYLTGSRSPGPEATNTFTTYFVRIRRKCVGQMIRMFWPKPIKFSDDDLIMLMTLLGAYEMEIANAKNFIALECWRFKSLDDYLAYSQECERVGCRKLRVLFSEDFKDCPQYIPHMTEEDHALYTDEIKRRHWMSEIRMTDYELEQAMIRHLGEERVKNYFSSLYYAPWTWVCNDVFKYYYEKGKFVLLGDEYLDGQNEAIIWDIMKARGDDRTFKEIVVIKMW